MIRRLVVGLIVLGLAVGVWALWPRENADPSPTTVPTAFETTTTTLATTTTARPTTSTTEETHVVASVEEAEEILRNLWFGWFEGIYNQDENRIREVVGTQRMLDAAGSQFGVMEFEVGPTAEAVIFRQSEILHSSDDCLVMWSQSDATFLEPGNPREGVDVMRRAGDSWLLVRTWTHRDDLWEADCEVPLESL